MGSLTGSGVGDGEGVVSASDWLLSDEASSVAWRTPCCNCAEAASAAALSSGTGKPALYALTFSR